MEVKCEYIILNVNIGLKQWKRKVVHDEMVLRSCIAHRLKSRVLICDTCIGNMLHGAYAKTIEKENKE